MDQFCTKCGTQLVNGVCTNCSGAQAAPQQLQYQQQAQYQTQQTVVNVNPNDERFKSFFMNPKENFVCALGNSYLQSFFASGFIGNGFAVVSDKRVYFKGKSYEIGEKNFKGRTTTSTVDLKDVTGTEVRTMRNFMLLIIGIVALVIALAVLFIAIVPNVDHLNSRSGPLLSAFCGAFLWIGIICSILYIVKRKTFLTINYAGGCIAFDVNWYPRQEGEYFQRMLRIAKDNAIEEAENATANTMREAMATVVAQPQAAVSSADELAKYAQLYKDGLISEQEFADIKAKIFAKQ